MKNAGIEKIRHTKIAQDVLQCYYAGMKPSEIAIELGILEATACQIIERLITRQYKETKGIKLAIDKASSELKEAIAKWLQVPEWSSIEREAGLMPGAYTGFHKGAWQYEE